MSWMCTSRYEELDGQHGLFKKCSWPGKEAPEVAKHRILTKGLEPPASTHDEKSDGYKRNEKEYGQTIFKRKPNMYQDRWNVLNGNPDTNARVAMTLVRGNMLYTHTHTYTRTHTHTHAHTHTLCVCLCVFVCVGARKHVAGTPRAFPAVLWAREHHGYQT